MSDFFMPTQKNDYWTKQENKNSNVQAENTQSDYWQKQSQKTLEAKQAQLENRQRYGVNVPDEYYDVFNKIISQAETPEMAQEEAYKIGSAVKYSQMMSIPLEEAYAKVDALNEAQFPDKLDQKGRFEAITDMFTLGNNNVKLGELGQKLMKAHRENDEELAQSLMAEIDAINQQNQLMQDNAPRSWVMQALEAGAQSLPFTGAVAGAGILGNFIAPAVGTGASFAASSYLSAGTEYIDMLANGANLETARAVAMVSGSIQGLIEADLGITSGIVKGAARVMGKEVAENAAKKGLEDIGRKVFKRFHFGAGKKVLVNYLENYGQNILSEGTEEFLQEITSIVGQEVAASLDGYDIPDDDFKSIVKQTTEAFRGGVLGALSMGFIPSGINAAADVKSFKAIKDSAEVIESEEVFKEVVKDNPVFEGMSDQMKAETIHDVWERAQQRKEEAVTLEAQKIAEVLDAAEGADERNVNEEGDEQAQPVARDENGKLMFSDDENISEDGIVSGTFRAGDKTKAENNRYGYIKYTADEKNKSVTIDDFKMAAGREGLRGEVYDEFARKYAGYSIEWNAVGSEAASIKESLINNNPAGAKAGLSYYADEDAVYDASTRAKVAAEVKKNIHNVSRVTDENGNVSFKRSELTNEQVSSAVALLEAAAKRTGMNLTEYVNKTFGNEIFGSQEDFSRAASAQGDNVSGKAGGVNPGVAQNGWKQFGQQVKAVIYAGENADFSTWAHELAHIFQSQLDGDLKAQAEKAFNVVGGDWINSTYTFKDGHTDSAAEAFAYGFQDWLKTGKAESEEMKNIFQKFAEFIVRAFNSLKDFINLTPEITSVYEQLLAGDDSLMAQAERAVEEGDRRYRAEMKKKAEEAENNRKAEAEKEKQSEQAEREEAGESTEFTEENTAEQIAEAEKSIDEVTSYDTEEENNAIDDALENTNLTDEEKGRISEVLKNENSTVIEKAEAATEIASSVYDDEDVIPDELFFQTTDLTQDFADIQSGKITDQDIKNYINTLIGQAFDTATTPLQIQIINGNKAHVIKSNIKLQGTKKAKHNAALNKVEQIINNASMIGKPESVDLTHNQSKATLKHKKNVLKYITFESPIKIGNDYYTVELITERVKGQAPELLNLYNVRVKKNNGAATPSNPNGLGVSQTAVTNNNITSTKNVNFIMYQIVGEIGAQNLDDAEVQEGVSRMQNLVIAKEMEKEHKTDKNIRLATGWEKGTDGKWKYEIPDGELVIPTQGQEVNSEGKFVPRKQKEGYLREYYKSDELYKAYPDLKYAWLRFVPLDVEGRAYYAGGDKIDLNINLLNYNKEDEIKSTIIHEIQHLIQRIEGFAKGGSESTVRQQANDTIHYSLEEKQKSNWYPFYLREVSAADFALDKKRMMKNPELIKKTGYWQAHSWAVPKKGTKDYTDYLYDRINGWMQETEAAIVRNDGYGEVLKKYYTKSDEELKKLKAHNKYQADKYRDLYFKINNLESKRKEYDQLTNYELYNRLAGEVEARNVETRMNFTQDQRRNILLAATEDVAPEDKIILFQKVYHGSGADFDKFDTENYGFTGEGSMSFGYGTYVTDSEEIARDYAERQRKSDNALDIAYSMLEANNFDKTNVEKELQEWIAQGNNAETYQKALEYIQNNSVEELKNKHNTNLYTIEIPDNGYIVWDKDVDTKTKKFVENAVYDKLTTEPNEDGDYVYKGAERELREELQSTFEADINGEELYNDVVVYLGDEKAASKFLNKLGFAGIDYPAYSNFGNAMGKTARNFVIFNDDDAKIVDHLFFQTQAELVKEAQDFDNWQDFMEYCESMHVGVDDVTPIPSDADAQWYQSFYETANGIQTEQEKNEQIVDAENKRDGMLPGAVDALFTTYIKSQPEMIDNFLQAVADIDAIDLDSEEWQHAESSEDAAQRERIEQLKDFINITLSDYNWQTALKRIQGGNEIAEGLRKRLIGEMTDSFKVRDFRALYAEIMNDEQYAVAPEDSITATLNKKLKKYHDIVKPNEDISKWSPEKRKRLAEQLQNKEIAAKIRNGSLKLDDELDAYIKSLDKQIKEKQKQFDELEAETKADYQRIADKERRDLLKLHEQLLIARSKLNKNNSEINRKIATGLKITEKYRYATQNLNANYDEIFRKYNDLKNTQQITADVQAALDRQEKIAGLKDDLNAKQKEKNFIAEAKKLRIQLVKRTMRRVPFNRIDYNNAKTIIAIQRMLEPNLLGGVNRFIGIDSPYLRGVISQIVTDADYKEKIMSYLSHNSKASQAFVDFKKKLEELKSIKDFDSWTAKERKAAIRYLPKENWVRDLNLKQLAKEREESIDLDIGMEEVKRTVYDEKTGEPKTYKDKEGNEYNVTETAFRLKANPDIERIVQDAVGADMFDKIVNMPFSEWTTEDLEQLAQRIDELYTEGRDLKAAKDEARKRAASAIRQRIEDAIKETGITINDDDTPEEKDRKQAQIDKILGMSSDLKGTEAGKTKGFKAKITRLLHSYSDMNVLRFARMLDGQNEGENYRLLYRMEDDCYNAKQRSISSRASTVNKVMADNKITEGDLAKSIKVDSLGTEFTVDELLYFLAADKDYVEDEKKLQRGDIGIDANDDYAATSRNAVMFGNMMSDMLSQEEKEAWLKLDQDMQDAIANDALTPEQKQMEAARMLDKRPGTTRYIEACHAKWEVVLGFANRFLNEHPEYRALMEAIEADYASQYERMNEVSINEFNTPVHRVKAYVPLVRRESNGADNVAQVKEDLLATYGGEAGKQWVNKGMTQRRVNISPLNQKPVQTGLFRTWGDSIERTEHFIAYAPYVRQLNAVYKSRDAAYTRRFIESRYGKSAIEYLDAYINEVANPNAGKIREKGAEWLHVLRGKTAPAYLGWKASGIIKQGLTSPFPYMQFVNPAEYLSAAMKFTFNPEMREAISEKSIYMKMRRMDPVNDLIDEMAENAKGKVDRAWTKFSQMGMQGLEFIDWACVAPGWLACYEKKYNQLQNANEARYNAKMEELKERNMYADIGTSEYLSPEQMEAQARKEMLEDIESEAIRYADDCTRACQPSNRVTDLAPLFKNSSEAMKAFLQFQTSLNVIWQNIRYDLPYAVKQKEFKRIAGTVIGYVMAGIFMNSVMDGVRGDDDDDEMQALRNLIYYSTTQFTDAIPIMGSEITNAMDKIITGKRAYSQSGTDMTPSATKLLSALQSVTNGDFKKAAGLTAEGIGLFLGAPVSGVKEINKLLGKPLSEGEIDIKKGVGDVYGLAGDILGE